MLSYNCLDGGRWAWAINNSIVLETSLRCLYCIHSVTVSCMGLGLQCVFIHSYIQVVAVRGAPRFVTPINLLSRLDIDKCAVSSRRNSRITAASDLKWLLCGDAISVPYVQRRNERKVINHR